MTQYQLTLDSETVQRLFTSEGQLGRLLEAVLNQVLSAQAPSSPWRRPTSAASNGTGIATATSPVR